MYIRIPFETDNGNVEPIEHDANQGHNRGNSDYVDTSVPEAKRKHKGWNQYETKHLYQIPVAPTVVNQIPLLAMNKNQCLQEIIDKHDDGRAFCQPKNDVVKRVMAFRGDEILKNSMAYGSFEDNHG